MRAAGYFPQNKLNRNSLLAIGITLIFHIVIILLSLYSGANKNTVYAQPTLYLIELKHIESAQDLAPKVPSISFYIGAVDTNFPTIEFAIVDKLPSSSSATSLINEAADNNYNKNIFDPKMQKKLIAAEKFNRVLQDTSFKSWRTSGGQVVDEIGDGQCMISIPKTDSHDRGMAYVMLKCGSSDSEKAMERVMADYGSRKAKSK